MCDSGGRGRCVCHRGGLSIKKEKKKKEEKEDIQQETSAENKPTKKEDTEGRVLAKRHMLSVYFSAALALLIIIVLACHFFFSFDPRLFLFCYKQTHLGRVCMKKEVFEELWTLSRYTVYLLYW